MKTSPKFLTPLIIIGLLIAAYFFVDGMLFDGVKPRPVKDHGFQATYFAKEKTKSQPTVIVMGGGQWGDYWGQEFAKTGYSGLSLPYFGQEGLPKYMENIPLEYFGKAIDWLAKQPEVDPKNIIVMGASRNAELALVVASYYPESVHGAIAFAPSVVSWSNTVMPHSTNKILPSWTFAGKPVSYAPMERITGGDSDTIQTLPYWSNHLRFTAAVNKTAIPVQNINGPILMLSGKDDQVWPSAMMSDMIEQRLEESEFKFEVSNVQYENAGHMISGNPYHPADQRHGVMPVGDKEYVYLFGGTAEGDHAAQVDAGKRVMEYLRGLGE